MSDKGEKCGSHFLSAQGDVFKLLVQNPKVSSMASNETKKSSKSSQLRDCNKVMLAIFAFAVGQLIN